MNCLFCNIIKKEIPSFKLYEDDKVYVFMDINPKKNGHILIIPKTHLTDVLEVSEDLLLYIKSIALKMYKIISDKLGSTGYTLLYNYGSTQEVKHFHVHLIPDYTTTKELLDVKSVYELLTK